MDINRIEENREEVKVNSEEGELRSLVPDGETTLENISTQEPLLFDQKFKNEWKNIGRYIKYYLYVCLGVFLLFPFNLIAQMMLGTVPVQPAVMISTGIVLALILVALLIYPLLSLWRSSKYFGQAVKDDDEQQLLSAIRYQKKFWKYLVIFTVSFIGIYFLFFIFLIFFGAVLGL